MDHFPSSDEVGNETISCMNLDAEPPDSVSPTEQETCTVSYLPLYLLNLAHEFKGNIRRLMSLQCVGALGSTAVKVKNRAHPKNQLRKSTWRRNE